MKNFLRLLALFTVLFSAIAFASNNRDFNQYVQTSIKQWMQENAVPGVAVEIVTKGDTYTFTNGVANLKTNQPISENTIFQIGSLTKLFTSLLLAEAIDAKQLKLNTPMTRFILQSIAKRNPIIKKITLEELASHTSGLPFLAPKKIINRQQLAQYFLAWQPKSKIGTRWEYSNFGVGLLGYVLEAKLHQNYNQLYRQRILLPLDMNPIGIVVPKRFLKNTAQGYTAAGKPALSSMGLFPAAASMKASAHDMLQFLKAAIGLSGTPKIIYDAMQLTETPRYKTSFMTQGLGWVIHPLPTEFDNNLQSLRSDFAIGKAIPAKMLSQRQQVFNPRSFIDKTGATEGFRAYIAILPYKKIGIVILCNRFIDGKKVVVLGKNILEKVVAN